MSATLKRFGIVISAISGIQGVIAPVLYLLLLDKGITLMEVGILLAILTGFGLVFEVPFGTLADNFGRKRVFLLGESVLLFAIFGFWLADSFAALALVMALNGIGTALISGTLDALFVEKHNEEVVNGEGTLNTQQSQAAFGTFQAAGLAIGSILAGVIPLVFEPISSGTELIGFYEMNVVVLIPLVVLHLALTGFLIPESGLELSNSIRESAVAIKPFFIDTLQKIKGSQVIVLLLVMEFMGGVAAISIEQLWQPRFADLIDAKSSTWAFGLIFTVNFVLVAIGQGLSVPLGKLFRHRYPEMLLVLELVVAGLLLLFAFQNSVGGFVLCFMTLALVGGATMSPFMAMFHESVEEEHRSTMLSAKSMFMQGGIMVGAVTAGALAANYDIKTAWLAAAAILIFSTLFYLLPPIKEFSRSLAAKERSRDRDS
ncbi:MAG: MFS transporter [Pyrinomonadaceae bacterium]|nr:MFS transporter [Pyrinomonadaceae bacterium]